MAGNHIKIWCTGGFLCVLLIVLGMPSYGQSTNKYIRKGNKQYKSGDYTDAEAEYKKALTRDSVSAAGLFNLGNSLYQQQRYQDAMQQYEASARHSTSDADASAAAYNIGNAFMNGKKWQEAIKAYQESLLKNPSDDAARYNLAYAQKMLKKQKNGGGGKSKPQNKQNQNKQQKNKQNKSGGKNKPQNKQNQNQNQNQKNDQNKEQQHPQPQPSKISRERADQLLNAASQAEKKLQEQKDKKKKKGVQVYNGKDW